MHFYNALGPPHTHSDKALEELPMHPTRHCLLTVQIGGGLWDQRADWL